MVIGKYKCRLVNDSNSPWAIMPRACSVESAAEMFVKHYVSPGLYNKKGVVGVEVAIVGDIFSKGWQLSVTISHIKIYKARHRSVNPVELKERGLDAR